LGSPSGWQVEEFSHLGEGKNALAIALKCNTLQGGLGEVGELGAQSLRQRSWDGQVECHCLWIVAQEGENAKSSAAFFVIQVVLGVIQAGKFNRGLASNVIGNSIFVDQEALLPRLPSFSLIFGFSPKRRKRRLLSALLG
jgi:hypothetical protein